MITAQQAKELTASKKILVGDIYKGIKTMAEGGYNYAAFGLEKISYPEDIQKELEENGYSVQINSTSFVVNW